MSAEPHEVSTSQSDADPFRRALQQVQPRPHCLLFTLPVIAASFILPGIALCGVLSRQGIIWSIVLTLAVCAVALYIACRSLESRDVSSRRASDLLMSAVLTLAAALLLAALALEPGPWRDRTLPISTAAAIGLGVVTLGVALLLARARRIQSAQRCAHTSRTQSP